MSVPGEDYEIWLEGVNRPTYPRATLPAETEYVVIGGGILGQTAAYLLTKENKKVVLFDKIRFGEWITDCTTGFLTQAIDTDPITLIKLFGVEKARLILASHGEAISGVEKIVKEENIDCDFERCSNYIYANTAKEEKRLIKATEAFKKLGVPVEFKKDDRLKFLKFGYIEMKNQGKFHIMKYITALAKISTSRGAILNENTEVKEVIDNTEGVSVILTDGTVIKTKKVIGATYVAFNEPKYLAEKSNLFRTYVLEYKLPSGTLMEGTYEDERDPYNYFRIDKQNGHDRMIIGGADNLDATKPDRNKSTDIMRVYVKELLTGFEYTEVRHWSGRILNSADTLAFIGESRGGNIFYTYAFGGNGITYSYIAGRILMDGILGKENPYKKVYDTDRKISFWTRFLL
jgi:glycine/D-amino acid oxidase-like deaminating enzyme